MKRTLKHKILELQTETIRELQTVELAEVQGGVLNLASQRALSCVGCTHDDCLKKN